MSSLRRCSLIAGLLAACRPPAPPPAPSTGDPCRIAGPSSSILDTVTIGYSELENDGRRVLLASNRTLIRQDCRGRVGPDLALRWTRDASGATWAFDLDTDTPAQAVVEQWEARRNGGIWPWAHILAVRAPGPARLVVSLDSAFADVPRAFGFPELAISPVRPTESSRPVIRIQVHSPELDERDILDQSPGGPLHSPDLLITRNPDLLSYVGSRPGLRLVPLPWDRVYVVVAPVQRPDLGARDTAEFRASLARDVVRADARPTDTTLWIRRAPCPGTKPLRPMGRLPQVTYLRSDPSARELAERMVAIQQSPLRVVGLTAEAFTASLAGGEAALYIVPLALARLDDCGAAPVWPSDSWTFPLVDTRAHAVLRPGVPPFSIDADGTLRFGLPAGAVPGEDL